MNWTSAVLIVVSFVAVIFIIKYFWCRRSYNPLLKAKNSLAYDNDCYKEAFEFVEAQLNVLTEYFSSLEKRSKDVNQKLEHSLQPYVVLDPSRKLIKRYSNSLSVSPVFARPLFTPLNHYRSTKYQQPLIDRFQTLLTAINSYCEVAGAIVTDTSLYVEKLSGILKTREAYEKALQDCQQFQATNTELQTSLNFYKNFYDNAKSNLTLFPYMAGIVAEFDTRDIEELAKKLDWGHNFQRFKKVESIRDIRRDAQEKIQQAKEAEYQLAYLLQMFPALQDVLDYEYADLPMITQEDLSDHDRVRDYLSKEEWTELSVSERNQLALNRYIDSRKKTKWQIGRDYEEYVGYRYRSKGFTVDNYGSYMGFDDLGRDVIAKKGNKIYIIQCKYWSQKKEIHENHVNQLFGTVTSYCIENNIVQEKVLGVIVTNTTLTERAKQFAARLGIKYVENLELSEYPRIKCNIGKNNLDSRIYHLPFDQQYDTTKICNPGEFYAFTVAEAESAGFRRAYKWHNNS